MPKKNKKRVIKNKNKNKNINKIVVNVNSNNKRKVIQNKKDVTPQTQSMPYVINNPQPIYQAPIQNDLGIGYHRLLEGLNNRLDILQQENQHLKTNNLIEEQKRQEYINRMEELQQQTEIQKKNINYEKINEKLEEASNVSDVSQDSIINLQKSLFEPSFKIYYYDYVENIDSNDNSLYGDNKKNQIESKQPIQLVDLSKLHEDIEKEGEDIDEEGEDIDEEYLKNLKLLYNNDDNLLVQPGPQINLKPSEINKINVLNDQKLLYNNDDNLLVQPGPQINLKPSEINKINVLNDQKFIEFLYNIEQKGTKKKMYRIKRNELVYNSGKGNNKVSEKKLMNLYKEYENKQLEL